MPRYIFIDNFDGKIYGDLAEIDLKLSRLSAEKLPLPSACRILDHLIGREGRGYKRLDSRPVGWMLNRRIAGYLVYLCEDRELVPLSYDPEDSAYIGSVKRDGEFVDYIQIFRREDELFDSTPYTSLPTIPEWET